MPSHPGPTGYDPFIVDDNHWMTRAIEQAREGISAGPTPFGTVIAADVELVTANHIEVWLRTDPTAHAEIVAVQAAARRRDRRRPGGGATSGQDRPVGLHALLDM